MCLFGTHGITLQEYKREDKFKKKMMIYHHLADEFTGLIPTGLGGDSTI